MRAQDRFAALRHRGFALYWVAIILIGFALQMQTVAVGWQVYELTRNPFDLGLVGLSQFAPALLLVLVTGPVADKFSRRRIIGVCLGIQALCALGLLAITLGAAEGTLPIFALLALFGAARAFYNPARQAILPNLVPAEDLGGAIALSQTASQVATISGPMVGGLLFGILPALAYGATALFLMIAMALMLLIPKPAQRRAAAHATWKMISGGFRFIWSEKVVLGAISLDLFAVLLGGAAALLPVYASDILEVGPFGLGALRSAMAVGAILMGGLLILRPIKQHAGHIMFGAVCAFGVFTLVFALSTTVWISVVALMLMGCADMVSVYVRGMLVQLWTPDELRGRVNAVNGVFVGASNELGGFRAGTMAALIGPVAAVAVGAAGTLAVTGLWMRGFPELRRIGRLTRT